MVGRLVGVEEGGGGGGEIAQDGVWQPVIVVMGEAPYDGVELGGRRGGEMECTGRVTCG